MNIKPILSFLEEIGKFVWDIGKTLIVVVAIAFIIRFYLVQPFYVEGQSMEPNFVNGEYLLIDEISYHFRAPERGEVIVFKPPVNTYQNYIKRIVGLPKEKISFDKGITIINEDNPKGIKLEEKYLSPQLTTVGEETPVLKDSEFFVMGDNRPNSSDSRMFGPLARKNVIGRAWIYIKIEPGKERNILGLKIRIPRITSVGKINKPVYNVNQTTGD